WPWRRSLRFPAQRHHYLYVDRADAQRRQLVLRRVQPGNACYQWPQTRRPNFCVVRDRSRGGGSCRRARHHHSHPAQPAITKRGAREPAQTLMPNQPILEFLWIIPLLPLLGAAINGLFGAKWPNKIVNTVALSATGLSFAAALEAVREFVTYIAPTG